MARALRSTAAGIAVSSMGFAAVMLALARVANNETKLRLGNVGRSLSVTRKHACIDPIVFPSLTAEQFTKQRLKP